MHCEEHFYITPKSQDVNDGGTQIPRACVGRRAGAGAYFGAAGAGVAAMAGIDSERVRSDGRADGQVMRGLISAAAASAVKCRLQGSNEREWE